MAPKPASKARATSARMPKTEKTVRQRPGLLSRMQEDNRKPCPHCGRMFSDEAAERHFPICERNSLKSKQMVVRAPLPKPHQPPLSRKKSSQQ